VDPFADLDCADGDFVIRSYHRDLVGSLQFGHGTLWNQERAIANLCYGAYFAVLPWPQNVPGIRKCAGDPDCSGLLIDLAIGEQNPAVLAVRGAVGKDQFQRNRWAAG